MVGADYFNIRVRASVTRTFEVDYIRSANSLGDGKESGAFWGELESQIKSLLSPKGRLVVNRLTGAIMVTDLPTKVDDVQRFIELMRNGMYRQIDIEVRIVEVTLRDSFALGLDWSRLRSNPSKGGTAFNTLITAPQAVSPLASTMAMSFNGDSYLALIEALRGPAMYIGAIGSRRNSESRRQRLIGHFGQTPESLRRLRRCIGGRPLPQTPGPRTPGVG